ncbi:MAG TPA: hypothetical protein VGQ83_26205 [Polyangia bacterium]|jgi:hypothetical protein
MWRRTALMLVLCGSSCGGETAKCQPNDHTACMEGVVYWLDSCGDQGAIADTCDCGCSADLTRCESCSCTPDCAGKVCGDNGCGGSCGACDGGQTCDATGQCTGCTPSCTGRVCGGNGCGGSCGACDGGQTCDATGQCTGGSTSVMAVNCTVPYVLDAAQTGSMGYMAGHFGDLVQQYCITGVVDAVDVTAAPEKMYYGQHDAGTTVSLVQTSMSAGLTPQYSVKIDMDPDSAVTTGASWTVGIGGLGATEAIAGLLKYQGTASVCLYAVGVAGTLTFTDVTNVTATEGGAFHVTGSFELGNPWDVTDFCSNTPAALPCCVR